VILRPAIVLALAVSALAQNSEPNWTPEERRVVNRLNLRALPDDRRAVVTRELALEIRTLPAGANKLQLASQLADLATEGDFGRDTLQEVTVSLEDSLREHPSATPGMPHQQLVQLVKYEGMKADLDGPLFAEIKKRLEADDAARASATFSLKDRTGKQWSLADLRGKVVLINFWATWCGPCRKEMPDLDALYEHFGPEGLLVLGVTDDELDKLNSYLAARPYTFPILLDTTRVAAQAFRVEVIPKSFVFDREGKLVAQAMDVRTRAQFLDMLGKAGLR